MTVQLTNNMGQITEMADLEKKNFPAIFFYF